MGVFSSLQDVRHDIEKHCPVETLEAFDHAYGLICEWEAEDTLAHCKTCCHRIVREEGQGLMAGARQDYCSEIGTLPNARTGTPFIAMRCEDANAKFCRNTLWKPTLTYRLRRWLGLAT